MNYEKLKELDDRFNAVDEQVKALSKQIEQLEKELAGAKGEPGFERKLDKDSYWYVTTNFGDPIVYVERESNGFFDNKCFENNNYFHTKERAQEVADKIRLLLKLERLHDIYCPDYKPDWSNNEIKYLILYNHTANRYSVGNAIYSKYLLPYFPTTEIAQKVCDILNAELKQDSAN